MPSDVIGDAFGDVSVIAHVIWWWSNADVINHIHLNCSRTHFPLADSFVFLLYVLFELVIEWGRFWAHLINRRKRAVHY